MNIVQKRLQAEKILKDFQEEKISHVTLIPLETDVPKIISCKIAPVCPTCTGFFVQFKNRPATGTFCLHQKFFKLRKEKE